MLAAALERFGIAPVVVEIEDASFSRGLGLMLTSNAVLALRRVGLEGVIVERGVVLERIVHTDLSGNPIEEHDLRPANRRYAPNLGITRGGLMSGLASALRARARYATTVVSVGGPGEEPEVVLSDGTRARFDLVVGADGINSAVREVIYPGLEPVYRSFCAWRTVMEGEGYALVFGLSSTSGCS
jgi:2-polyprenyl-6-methoxyphenol hydroxylase-like FAD-dependent oxidoreductase